MPTASSRRPFRIGYTPLSKTSAVHSRRLRCSQPFANVFPDAVLRPGAPVAHISGTTAERTGLSPACTVGAGTTGMHHVSCVRYPLLTAGLAIEVVHERMHE